MSVESLTLLIFFCSLFFFSILELSFSSDTITPTWPMNDGETLISANQTFELGFFSRGNSKKRYLGIWYKNSPETVVWVANRNNPITDPNGVLTFNNHGNLVLLNLTRSIIWSSNVSWVPEKPVAQLLDSGNIVLRDNITSSDNYLWQSFDYPSDTLLPGMKLGWNLKTGRERYLTSWRSANDPSPGNFTFRLDIHGLPQLVIGTGLRKLYRTGPWNGLHFGGIPVVPSLIFKPMLVWNKNELYYKYEAVSSAVTMRLIMNESGSIERLIWDDRKWSVLYSVPFRPCDNYGRCGANGICRISKVPICGCLEGFIPKSQDELGIKNQSWSKICVRELPLDCQRGDRFLKLTGTKLPDLLEVWLNNNMNLTECEAKCLKNCSCTAYANANIIGGGRGCLMWFGDLIDLREVSEEYKGQDIYIRLSASRSELKHDSNMKKILKTSLVVSTISGMFVLGLVICIIWKKTNKRGMKSRKEDTEVPLFDFATIGTATNNFSEANIIGVGGFGPVYKGDLLTGQEIAVKRLSKNSRQGVEEFRNEIILIAQLQHRNLVGLLGSCIQGEERMLIYEYMPNKSLDYFIFDHKRSRLLAWQKRFDIVMGIARGLLYLHQDSKLQIIHRDLKASNILLDSDLNPKISDFGLARIFEGDDREASTKRVVGTYGYMSPEYAIEGTFSVKSDVYGMGVLLLEIVSGKKNRGFCHPNHHHNLLGHAWLLWCEDRALELMDSCLKESCVRSQVLRCIHVALLCVQKFPEDRPAMSSVVLMLANEGATLLQPKEPGFFTERRSIDVRSTSGKEISHTENAVTITMLQGR